MAIKNIPVNMRAAAKTEIITGIMIFAAPELIKAAHIKAVPNRIIRAVFTVKFKKSSLK
jgi:hypothetical protein